MRTLAGGCSFLRKIYNCDTFLWSVLEEADHSDFWEPYIISDPRPAGLGYEVPDDICKRYIHSFLCLFCNRFLTSSKNSSLQSAIPFSSHFLKVIRWLLTSSCSSSRLFGSFSIFPSITCFRRQFPRKMWPAQLTVILFIVCTIEIMYLTLYFINVSPSDPNVTLSSWRDTNPHQIVSYVTRLNVAV